MGEAARGPPSLLGSRGLDRNFRWAMLGWECSELLQQAGRRQNRGRRGALWVLSVILRGTAEGGEEPTCSVGLFAPCTKPGALCMLCTGSSGPVCQLQRARAGRK